MIRSASRGREPIEVVRSPQISIAAPTMAAEGLLSDSVPALEHVLTLLSQQIRDSLSKAQYTQPDGSNVSIKSFLQSLVPQNHPQPQFQAHLRDFTLCCAALASSQTSKSDHLSWIPNSLSVAANSAFRQLSEAFCAGLNKEQSTDDEKLLLLIELLPEVLPLLKSRIKESSIDKDEEDGDEVSAASARVPVGYAVVAAHQLRWLVTKLDYPHLGKLSSLVIPCALTVLDHWSPEVKGQGMICFIHLMKNVNTAELGGYSDVILDACCQNVASDDEIWEHVVEMSVLVVTCTQQSNPRSSWYEKLLNEMLSHLERQPRNKERRVVWLKHIEPVFNCMGLVLLAHFRRILPLFFKWVHADDDETVLLVLDRINTVMKLTWVRHSPYVDRLVDELVILYKDAAVKVAREDIRTRVVLILILLQRCKGQQFEAAWLRHKDDPDVTNLCPFLNQGDSARAVQALPIETQ